MSTFNICLLDNPNARSWGEKAVWDPDGPTPTGTADADGKWNVEVIANPWGPGWLVQWWTEQPTNCINTLSDIGEFSFAGTAYWDNNENGFDASDLEVQVGETARIWFGTVNWTESDGHGGWTQEWGLHFDEQGWGARTPNAGGPWAAEFAAAGGYGSGYEGVLEIEAIPEPATIIVWSLLGLIAGGYGLWRRWAA